MLGHPGLDAVLNISRFCIDIAFPMAEACQGLFYATSDQVIKRLDNISFQSYNFFAQ